jgi:hypothetical protein
MFMVNGLDVEGGKCYTSENTTSVWQMKKAIVKARSHYRVLEVEVFSTAGRSVLAHIGGGVWMWM